MSERLDARARPAVIVLGVQALVLVGLALVLVVDVVRGQADGVGQALAEAALVVVFAALAAGLAAGVGMQQPWARTPGLLWHVFLVPVGISMLGGGVPVVGAAVLLVALAGLVTVWQAMPMRAGED